MYVHMYESKKKYKINEGVEQMLKSLLSCLLR